MENANFIHGEIPKVTRAKYQIPALFFLLAAAIVATALLLSRFRGFAAMDVYVHDTYYVVSHTFIFYALSVYFLACAILYLILEKVARKGMSAGLGHLHLWLSTVSVGVLLYSFYKVRAFLGIDVAHTQAAMHFLAEFGFAAFFGFLAAQIVFLVNIASSFFRRS